MDISVSELTVEHYRDPFGISEERPRLSWKFAGDAKNWIQKRYELRVKIGEGIEETYEVQSPQSVLVPWPTRPLRSREVATARVRAFGHDNVPTLWSREQTIEVGLISAADWKCFLIEARAYTTPENIKRPILFRRDFYIDREFASARLYATAHGVYEASINGQAIGDEVLAPGWTSYRHRLLYQTYDITHHLKKGQNAMGAVVAEGWWAGRLGIHGGNRNIWGEHLGFIAQIVIDFEDGSTQYMVTDDRWTAGFGGIIESELYDGEIYDSIQEPKGWDHPGFDDTTWTKVSASSIYAIVPTLVPSDAPPVRRIEEKAPVSIFKSPLGKVIVDFGQNLVGRLRVNASGSQGHTISFQHVEVLEHGEACTRPLWGAKARDTLILGSESETWEPKFTYHGFRYVEINGWPSEDGLPVLDDLTAVVLHTDMERTGWFECSEPLLNQLHQNIVWSMRGNFLSIPTDCPQRGERLGWTGDIQAFTPTATYLYNCTGFLRGWLKDVAFEQGESGGTVPPLVVPDVLLVHPKFSTRARKAQAIWGDSAISIPWELYSISGDSKVLSQQYQSMQSWIDHGIPRRPNQLWDTSNHPQLGDWLDPNADPNDPGNGRTDGEFVANSFLIGMTDLMAKASQVLGKDDESRRYTETAASLRQEVNKEYITPRGRVAGDSQTALALAIYFSLFETSEQAHHAGSRLVDIIKCNARFKIATGFAGTPLISHALTAVGQSQIFYRMLLHRRNPSWLYPVTMGATTVWERWDSMLPDGSINPGLMTSFNHYALGAVADWMHKVIGGIQAAEPGWRKAHIAPVPGGNLTWAKGSFSGPYGTITSEWKIEGTEFELKIKVPPNSTAVVHLPGIVADQEVGSGVHTFRCTYKRLEWPPKPNYGAFYRGAGEDDEI